MAVSWTWVNSALELMKEHGPTIGLLIAFIIWQAIRIEGLMKRNANIYEKEIERLVTIQKDLLERLLGPQSSSNLAPNVSELKRMSKNSENNSEGGPNV